jgi:hypothetical protein
MLLPFPATGACAEGVSTPSFADQVEGESATGLTPARRRASTAVASGDAILEAPMPDMPTIKLDTLNRLAAYGHGLGGWCLDCSARYRPATPAAERARAGFDVDIAALITERGPAASAIRMAPVPCPRCGSRRTECRITTPSRR